MPGANLIFHVTSAVLLLALVAVLLRLKNQRNFLRKLITSSFGQPGLIVDYPADFFNNFARACHIKIVESGENQHQMPPTWRVLQKIKPLELLKLHGQFRVKSLGIQLTSKDQGLLVVQDFDDSQQKELPRPNKVDLGFTVLDVEFVQKRNPNENK